MPMTCYLVGFYIYMCVHIYMNIYIIVFMPELMLFHTNGCCCVAETLKGSNHLFKAAR